MSDSGGKFVKMKSGDKITGLFVGDPVTFEQHWVDGKSATCNGDGCVHCENGEKASLRFQINFMTLEDGVWMAKIFEQGKKTLKTLAAFHQEYNLEETLVNVTKQGEKMTTVYNLLPAKVNVTKAELEAIRQIPLNKLGKAPAPTVVSSHAKAGNY